MSEHLNRAFVSMKDRDSKYIPLSTLQASDRTQRDLNVIINENVYTASVQCRQLHWLKGRSHWQLCAAAMRVLRWCERPLVMKQSWAEFTFMQMQMSSDMATPSANIDCWAHAICLLAASTFTLTAICPDEVTGIHYFSTRVWDFGWWTIDSAILCKWVVNVGYQVTLI